MIAQVITPQRILEIEFAIGLDQFEFIPVAIILREFTVIAERIIKLEDKAQRIQNFIDTQIVSCQKEDRVIRGDA